MSPAFRNTLPGSIFNNNRFRRNELGQSGCSRLLPVISGRGGHQPGQKRDNFSRPIFALGSILGVVIGAALMRVIYNSINLMGIPTNLEFAIIGTVILVGVIADELFKRIAAERKARLGAAMAERDAADVAASGET